MFTGRRSFIKWCTTAGIGLGARTAGSAAPQAATERPGGQSGSASRGDVPAVVQNLRPMTDGIVPISDAERRARLEKARRLMTENGLGAILLEGGSSLFYFTGEPMIAIYGEFGIRLEDCLHITEEGARFFTTPSPSIDRPFA